MKITLQLILIFTSFISIGQSNSYDSLNVNNITARFYSGGQMFSDTSISGAGYEFMQGSGHHTINTASLWMGGLDVNGQLKLSAQLYGTGDYFYGPAGMGFNTGNQPGYDFVWKITKQEIDSFVAYYQCSIDPACTPSPGYTIPNSILNWPAHGDINQGQDFYLAPFVDVNNDGIYEPNVGDYPCIKGDMAIFTIYNDIGTHTASGGDMIGAQVKVMHYAYDHDPTFSGNDSSFLNTIFSEYSIKNHSTQTLHDFYIGIMEDMDIGCPDNDYVGCDLTRALGYTYNSANPDVQSNDPCPLPYGINPPAQGITILKGIKAENDSMDNPLTTDIPQALSLNGIPYEALGCGYGDNIVDNEYRGMTRFMYYDRILSINAQNDPVNPFDYYNYLNGMWKDSSALYYGGTGHSSSSGSTSNVTAFAFAGNSDPYFWATSGVNSTPSDWSEVAVSNVGGDRRSISILGPINFQPGESYEFAVANITGRESSGAGTGLNKLFNITDTIRDYYYACEENVFNRNCNDISLKINTQDFLDLLIYPNPTSGLVYFESTASIQSISLYNLMGELIYRTTSNVNSVDLSDFVAGIYFVELIINERKIVRQLVKN